MARLPQLGGDNGNWGAVLNDYLLQSHNANGTLKNGSVSESHLDNAMQAKLNSAAATSSSTSWADITNKPAVIAAGSDQPNARAAIDTPGTVQVASMSDIAALRVYQPELHQVFTKLPNSSSAPTQFSSGQTASSLTAVGSNQQQYIAGGRLRSTPTNAGIAAAYYRGQLSAVCKRIGARFSFVSHSTTGGTIAFGVSTTQIVNGTVPAFGIHYVINPVGWQLQYSTTSNGALNTIASGSFATPLVQDSLTEYETEITVVSSTAYINLPDGSQVMANVSAANPYAGSYVFFEHFANAGNTDNEVMMLAVWADSGNQRTPKSALYKPLTVLQKSSNSATTALATNNTTTIPELTSAIFTAPASGRIEVTVSVYLQVPSSATLRLDTALDGASSAYVAKVLVEAYVGNRQFDGRVIFTGLTAGGNYIVTPKIFTSAAGGAIYQNPGSGYQSSLTIRDI